MIFYPWRLLWLVLLCSCYLLKYLERWNIKRTGFLYISKQARSVNKQFEWFLGVNRVEVSQEFDIGVFLKYDCTGLVREVDLRKQNSNVYMEIFVSVFTDMVSGFYALNSKNKEIWRLSYANTTVSRKNTQKPMPVCNSNVKSPVETAVIKISCCILQQRLCIAWKTTYISRYNLLSPLHTLVWMQDFFRRILRFH